MRSARRLDTETVAETSLVEERVGLGADLSFLPAATRHTHPSPRPLSPLWGEGARRALVVEGVPSPRPWQLGPESYTS